MGTTAQKLAKLLDTKESIKQAIIDKGVAVSDSDTFASYANKIREIKNSGETFVGIPREIDANGKYIVPTKVTSFSLPANVTDIGRFGFSNAFYNCKSLTSVDLSSLIKVTGDQPFINSFMGCSNLISVDLSNLTTISGYNPFNYTFYGCYKLTSFVFPKLTTVTGQRALDSMFGNCTSLTTLSFPALNSNSFGSYTNQFYGMLYGVTGCTVHFPSNLESVIGSWSDVISGFGGTNTTVLFDLPARE